MAAHDPRVGKRYYTPAQANAALPLVRAIVQDIADLGRSIGEREERSDPLRHGGRGRLSPAHEEESQQGRKELERDHERMRELVQELTDLGVELKDDRTGLIDFRSRMDGREVYLCWRLGEPSVAYWHELDAGFAGRQKLKMDPSRV
jgi:hypothetical protein